MQYLVRCYVYHESKQAGPWDSRRSPSHPTMGALTLRVWVTLSVFIGFWKFKLSFSYFLGKWFIHWTLSPAPSFISQYKSSFHFYIQKGGRLFSIQYYFCLNMQPCSLIQSSNGCLLRTHYTIHSGREGKDEIGADYTAAIFSSIEDLYRIKVSKWIWRLHHVLLRHGLAYHILAQYRSEAEDDIELWSSCLYCPLCWNYRHMPQHPAYSEWTQGFLHMR